MTPASALAGKSWDAGHAGHGDVACADAHASHPYSHAMPVYVAPPPNRFSAFVLRLWAKSPAWTAPLAIATCFAGVAAYTVISDPTNDNAASVPTCLVKLTTGFDCPGCGGTRAFWYLMHGNLPEAARHHALAVFAAPFLVWMYVAWVAQTVFHRKVPQLQLSPTVVGVFLAVWGVFSVLRNLPWAPFTSFYV